MRAGAPPALFRVRRNLVMAARSPRARPRSLRLTGWWVWAVRGANPDQGARSQVEKQQAELEQMEGIVLQTSHSLEAERQKALLLVRNFAPQLAHDLQREFA